MAQYPIPPHKTKTSNHKAWRGIGWREKGLPMSLKSFTLLDELSLEGSLRKSVQGECCAASLLAGITEPQPRTQRVNSEAPLSLPPAGLQGIPETRNLRFRSWSIPGRDNSPKGSGASKAHGKASTSQSARRNFPCEKEIPVLKKRVPLCEKDVHTLKKFLIESIWWKIVYNSHFFAFKKNCRIHCESTNR